MALFKVLRGLESNLPESIKDGYAYLTTDQGKFYIDTPQKRILINPNVANKIKYNNSTVQNALENLEQHLINVEFDTTSNWNSSGKISQVQTFYIYTDYQTYEGQLIPGVKIGDGLAYIVDLPFLDVMYLEHIQNADIHITSEERTKWNNKVSCEYKTGEQLQFENG